MRAVVVMMNNPFCPERDREVLPVTRVVSVRRWLDGRGISERISVLTTKGYIKFFRNPEEHGLPELARRRQGYLCVDGMQLGAAEDAEEIGCYTCGGRMVSPNTTPHLSPYERADLIKQVGMCAGSD